MAAQSTKPKTCNICHATSGANGSAMVWRQVAPKVWRLYETDGAGNPTQMHGCHAKMGSGRSASVPNGAYGVPSAGATIDEDATSQARQQATDLADIYNVLDAMDQEQARREPAHAAIVDTYEVVKRDESGAMIPVIDAGYMIDEAKLDTILAVIDQTDETGKPANIGLYGPPGSGKSSLGIQIGAIRSLRAASPTFVIDSSDKQTADEWFGTSTLEDGAIRFIASDFVKAIETPGATVILDDVNLLQSRTVQNGLNAILDPTRRAIFIHNIGRIVQVAPRVVIIGTWNKDTVSSSPLSEQIVSRFRSGCMFEIGYPENGTLAGIIQTRTGVNRPMADRLTKLAEWMRADSMPIEVDTRGLIATAVLIIRGRPLGYALAHVLFADLDAGERARAYTIIDVNLGNLGADEPERKLWYAPMATDVSLGERFPASRPIENEELSGQVTIGHTFGQRSPYTLRRESAIESEDKP